MLLPILSFFSICKIITCPTPTVTKIPNARQIVLLAPSRAKEGEKVWVELLKGPKNTEIEIQFGDKAFTQPQTDTIGTLKTWHTYGCKPTEYQSEYPISILLKKKIQIGSKIIITCATPPISPRVLSPSVTGTPPSKPASPLPTRIKPTSAPTSTTRPIDTRQPTRSVLSTPTDSKYPSKKIASSTNSTKYAKNSTAPTIFSKTKPLITYVLKPTTTENVCSGMQVIVSTLLYGRVITLPYLAQASPRFPTYDVKKTISADQMFEYQAQFKPTRVAYAQDNIETGKTTVFEIKDGKTYRSHFYLQGFYSTNNNILNYTAQSPINDETIIQTTNVHGKITFTGNLKNGTVCGLSFQHSYEAPADFLQNDRTIIEEGNKPVPYE